MNLDDLLADAIAEGKASLEKAKQERAEKKKSFSEKRALAAKLLSEDVSRQVIPVHRGIFEITCIVAEYVRRSCKNCNHTELCSVPRVFLCEQQIGIPTTRRLHRVHSLDTVTSHIRRGLPVKTEVFTSPAPFCRHCVKEVLDATRKTEEISVPDSDLHPGGSVHGTLPSNPGDIRGETPPDLQAWGSESISHFSDQSGSEESKEFQSLLPGGSEG